MAVKKCCIKNCKSCSIRKEDAGVTYHKFPKDLKLCETWITVTRNVHVNFDFRQYVCSRHFRKSDFKIFKDSKYMLKTDAIPSIFDWDITKEIKMEVDDIDEGTSDNSNSASLNNSRDSEPENVDAIKKFIDDQEKERVGQTDNGKSNLENELKIDNDPGMKEKEKKDKIDDVKGNEILDSKELNDNAIAGSKENVSVDNDVKENKDNSTEVDVKTAEVTVDFVEDVISETMSVCKSVMNVILTESESKISKKKFSCKDVTCAPLSVGSQVEAKDFADLWHPANVTEVDHDEMEVLVHYNEDSKRPDEWINVYSPRLRPIKSKQVQQTTISVPTTPKAVQGSVMAVDPKKSLENVNRPLKPKQDRKTTTSSPATPKVFRGSVTTVGPKKLPENVDRPLKPKQQTTISAPTTSMVLPGPKRLNMDLSIPDTSSLMIEEKGMFVVGERCLARWRDNRRFTATISKTLDNGSYEVMFDDGFIWKCGTSRLYKLKLESETGSPSPTPSGPSLALGPAFHTHLFDPTRDHLGSKSERREMKRKLNIKEIFNIGVKKRKNASETKVGKPDKVKKKKVERKSEAKNVQDSVASIIGTIGKKEAGVKIESAEKEKNNEKRKIEAAQSLNDSSESSTDKIDYDPVEKEEVKLEKFEPDEVKYAEVIDIIDRIKEEISRLEESSTKPEKTKAGKSEKTEVSKPEITENTKSERTEETKAEKTEAAKHEETIPVAAPELIIKIDKIDPVNQNNKEKEDIGDVSNAEVEENLPSAPAEEAQEIACTSDGKITNKIKESERDKKIRKSKKLRMLREKKVKKEVKKVKNELLEMKKQVEEMKKQIFLKTEEMLKNKQQQVMEMPESFLLPGEWCCKWINGQPVGQVCEIQSAVKMDANNKPALPRRSVQVEDKRLPPEWTKHMVRRSLGHSAGKWDVVLVSPDNKRFHTRNDMRIYLENYADEETKKYEAPLMDFGVHMKLAQRMGWVSTNSEAEMESQPVCRPSHTSPLIKTKKFSSRKREGKVVRKRKINIKKRKASGLYIPARGLPQTTNNSTMDTSLETSDNSGIDRDPTFDNTTIEDGYVYVGSLKVQIIENLLRCPAEGCYKNFRNNTLLRMHIKHYHRNLTKLMGVTPKVLDLAYARAVTEETETPKDKAVKGKVGRQRRVEERVDPVPADVDDASQVLTQQEFKLGDKIPRSLDSPKLRKALTLKPKRPKVLLPVKRPDEDVSDFTDVPDFMDDSEDLENELEIPPIVNVPEMDILDFEQAISTHTVTRPVDKKKRSEKRKFATVLKNKSGSEDDDWCGMNSDVDTMSSFPRSGTPDSKTMDSKSERIAESNEEQKNPVMYTYENGEKIKIVHMKREEIINCHCGIRGEDGLMVQCELCLCWQHGLCHNIHKESDVPEKYTCSICVNPRRGRRSQRFLHDQDRLYEGLLPGARANAALRRSHELSGNLLRIHDALHALRVKYFVATKKGHPKLYLWAKDWENGEINMTIERLNSDYSDLNVMINNVGKENLPMRTDELRDLPLSLEDQDGDRYSQKEGQLGSQALLSGLLSSPGGTSLDLPISTSELEKLARTVQEQESGSVGAPQPEAAIENSACRERLLRHVQRCQALIDARLDSIEAQVAELESQDPSFEDDETADYFPRTKQTIQMLMRDLDTMESLGVLT